MNSFWELILYVPVTLAALLVLEVCKSAGPRKAILRALKNFTALTLVLLVGSAAVFLFTKYF
jgi:hypothetical protein